MSKVLRDLGIEIPPEENTPTVRRLVELVEQLVEKINQLEGRPALPKRPNAPGSLEDPEPPSDKPVNPSNSGKKKGGSRKGAKRSKFKDLEIHDTVVLQPAEIPEGAKPLGYKSFIQQELRLRVVNTRYRRAQYRMPDGTVIIAPRPAELMGHYGPELRCFVLQQHYQSQVTQPLIHQQLTELGIKISKGALSDMLIKGHDQFHQEKADLLPAAREVSSYFQSDDTTARHLGKNGHTLHIGNEFFASFFTTMSKSRINFLEILRAPYADYVLGEDALFYLEYHGLPKRLREELASHLGGKTYVWESEQEWLTQLDKWKFCDERHRRLLTEAALWGSLMEHDLYVNQPMLSDDAGQFKLLGFSHGLCWLHVERHVARMVPLNRRQKRAYDKARDAIWRYYQELKAYRQNPNQDEKDRLEAEFDRLFLAKSGWPELNAAMRKIHSKKAELLLVLDYPELPLHNNLSENDIRQFAKMRKISGSTRSEAGRLARDTFLSLKTTCRKLGISFWQYLRDRIFNERKIRPLADEIRQKATPSVA